MASAASPIHPTALIDPEAELAPDVRVGPYVVIEGPVRLGPGCVVRPFAHLIGPLTAGRDNDFGTGVVIGDRPQHLLYNGEPTRTEIGDGNTFREHVTVHRGTASTGATVIGSHNFFMAYSHVAHDCRVGNHCILANGALLGGHCVVEDRALLSGHCAVHQFVRIGRLSMLSGISATSRDVPPFILQMGLNRVEGVNLVGMRRAGFPPAEIQAVRQAFAILYRQHKTVAGAVLEIEAKYGHSPAVREMIAFIRASKRGICGASHAETPAEEEAA
ncbi:MAG TPA: acyl-ACP--UDP-N-acetylglucosamine O-acyltransferase [Gemmataceae bacterium]